MAFISIPVIFVNEDESDDETLNALKQTSEGVEGDLIINTNMLCDYNEMDNKNTVIRMANGDVVQVCLNIKNFENILGEVESIIEIPKVSPN